MADFTIAIWEITGSHRFSEAPHNNATSSIGEKVSDFLGTAGKTAAYRSS
jgi:hypothetical protein